MVYSLLTIYISLFPALFDMSVYFLCVVLFNFQIASQSRISFQRLERHQADEGKDVQHIETHGNSYVYIFSYNLKYVVNVSYLLSRDNPIKELII